MTIQQLLALATLIVGLGVVLVFNISPATSQATFAGRITIATSSLDVTPISQAEDAYFAKTGHYFQLLAGGKLPGYETGKLTDYIASVDPNVAINTQQYPDGTWGYQVVWSALDANNIMQTTAFAIGEDAANLSKTTNNQPPQTSATSTPN